MPRSLRARSSSAVTPFFRSRTSAASCGVALGELRRSRARCVVDRRLEARDSRTPSVGHPQAVLQEQHDDDRVLQRATSWAQELSRARPHQAIRATPAALPGTRRGRRSAPLPSSRLDAQQLVVLGDAVRARQRAGLDLRRRASPPRCRRWWCPRSRPSGARRPRRSSPASAMSMAASVSVSVPIWLGLMRIALAIFLSMPSFRIFVLVTNRSSPTSCTCLPSALREQRPAVPVAFGHAVFDRDDRIAAPTRSAR